MLSFEAKEVYTGCPRVIRCPTDLLVAYIAVDGILSYTWLAEFDFDMCARRHGLRTACQGEMLWVPGLEASQTHKCMAGHSVIQE